jgi:hypothetical protein
MGKISLALCVVACAIFIYPEVSGYWTKTLSLKSVPTEKFISKYSNPAEADAEDCGMVKELLQAQLQHFPALPFDWDFYINDTCARQAMVSLESQYRSARENNLDNFKKETRGYKVAGPIPNGCTDAHLCNSTSCLTFEMESLLFSKRSALNSVDLPHEKSDTYTTWSFYDTFYTSLWQIVNKKQFPGLVVVLCLTLLMLKEPNYQSWRQIYQGQCKRLA